jgi:hypothetical protein
MRSLPAAFVLPRREAATLGYNLALLLLMALTVALGAAFWFDRAMNAESADNAGRMLVRNVAGVDLTIPAGWMRNVSGTSAGFNSEVDLRLTLAPQDIEPFTLDMSIVPRSRVRASATMLDAVYVHQFAPETLEGPAGLIGKPLLAGSGLAGESVWYDPIASDPFVARCLPALRIDQPDRCLRTILLPRNLALVLSFPAPALDGWRQFDTALADILRRLGALPL